MDSGMMLSVLSMWNRVTSSSNAAFGTEDRRETRSSPREHDNTDLEMAWRLTVKLLPVYHSMQGEENHVFGLPHRSHFSVTDSTFVLFQPTLNPKPTSESMICWSFTVCLLSAAVLRHVSVPTPQRISSNEAEEGHLCKCRIRHFTQGFRNLSQSSASDHGGPARCIWMKQKMLYTPVLTLNPLLVKQKFRF